MINENIYNKLTPSAKEELEDLTNEFREELLSKAFAIAQERDTANKEISLRDVLEAKQYSQKLIEKQKPQYKKKRYTIILSLTGAVYAVAGILIYLIQNRTFSLQKDFGLIIAIIGILVSLIGFFYGQLLFYKRSLLSKDAITTSNSTNNPDFEIVRRWQIIEALARKLMTESDQKEAKNNSVGFLIRFLSHKVAKNEKEFLKIRELLQLRNKILHEQYKTSNAELQDFLTFADELIERLEDSKTEVPLRKDTLKVISAKYGTSKSSFDMTKELNQLISNNRLEFLLNNEIIGDPDPGKLKQLEITFDINGSRQTRTYNEGAKVVIQ